MRSAIWGIVIGCFVVCLVSYTGNYQRQLFAQFPSSVRLETDSASSELIALSSDTQDGQQQITVIDPQSRVMSVYHVDHATGMISLKSVRSIHADLLMDEFNTDSPLPREIRAILKQR
jgi:hypothetical protein